MGVARSETTYLYDYANRLIALGFKGATTTYGYAGLLFPVPGHRRMEKQMNPPQPPNGPIWWRSPLVTAIGADFLSGFSAVIIMGQRVAVLEASEKVLEQRVADIDSHGSRQVISMEGRIKGIEDRNIEQDHRLTTAETTLAAINSRFVI